MRKFAILFFVLLFASLACASTYSAVVVYGDSLSDNGNLYAATGQPGAPYYMGRRSNGPVAVEDLAALFGTPLYDFAWIGATTGIGNYADGGTPTSLGAFGLPGMEAEFAGTSGLITPALAATGLFVVWGGPNDFLSPSPLDATPIDVANRGVADLLSIVSGLHGLGVQNILVPGMPDLGLTPYFQSLGPAAAAGGSFITNYFNSMLVAGLPTDVTYFDTAGLMHQIVADPSAYGFTNVTDPCFNGTTVCANPDQYLFFDSFHPTAAAHQILGQEFAAAVPEPATCVLVFSGALVALRKKKMFGKR
jgi:phospholipase/lecithinase/hemolysin